uniref:NADH dehydrogenase [ubiquinone] flavoprotein 3, mitochondrial n=1 Tax=Scleropages formosus TaxID=113540 RepID=A0A8C9R6Y8_SCLFO
MFNDNVCFALPGTRQRVARRRNPSYVFSPCFPGDGNRCGTNMAARFLHLVWSGSLKGLQVESCGALRGCPSAAFATSAGEPKKPGKKAKAPKAPPPPPEPEPEPEPFDNSTYKNLQHHQYNKYTFLDTEVEMAKHRLPQPSSGRPSPRH